MPTLYQRVLGDAFDELHPVLRRFHASRDGAAATGVFRVIHGRGPWRRLAIVAMRLPPAGDAVEVKLAVTATAAGETWRRWFGGRLLETDQYALGALLVERAGPTAFGLRTTANAGGMRFETERLWLCGLPWPRALGPSVAATVRPLDDGWSVVVRLAVPGLGEVLRYEGEIRPRWTPS